MVRSLCTISAEDEQHTQLLCPSVLLLYLTDYIALRLAYILVVCCLSLLAAEAFQGMGRAIAGLEKKGHLRKEQRTSHSKNIITAEKETIINLLNFITIELLQRHWKCMWLFFVFW